MVYRVGIYNKNYTKCLPKKNFIWIDKEFFFSFLNNIKINNIAYLINKDLIQ